MAQPRTFGCATNQPGYVGNDETLVIPHANNPKVRLEGRKRVVSYLWPRGRDSTNKC